MMQYVETLPNGFYYVAELTISECPNCYHHIMPHDFIVNVVTFLMTGLYNNCDFIMYVVHESLDNKRPSVCIITNKYFKHFLAYFIPILRKLNHCMLTTLSNMSFKKYHYYTDKKSNTENGRT